ncbi:MAG: transglycosylase domain-containing protein [Myxococcaceae bacterium]
MKRQAKRPARFLRKLLFVGVLAAVFAAVVEYFALPSAVPLEAQNPTETALMQRRADEARAKGRKPRRRQAWVALSAMAKPAVDAVIASEDASFFQHEGVDTTELRKALEQAVARGELGRGASTITQQLAKNLWLSSERSLLRKVKELLLARRLEKALTKSRILTLYLNVVEWGDGVYGIEAAALEHFGVSARELTPAQGVVLAAMLPSPRKRLPKLKSQAHYRHAARLLEVLTASGRISPTVGALARQELLAIFGKVPEPPPELSPEPSGETEPSPTPEEDTPEETEAGEPL